MSQSPEEIKYQARQGSITAIISLLNEHLKDDGITTRAVLDQGKLQLLCEAENLENLEQSSLVPKVITILNQIAPTNFKKVIINCRMTQQKQALWLEEIRANPEKNLLWYQEIKIKKPNLFQQLFLNYQYSQNPQVKKREILHDLARQKQKNQQKSRQNFTWELSFAVSLGILIIAGGWWFILRSKPNISPAENINQTSLDQPTSQSTSQPITTSNNDEFNQAVNFANSAYAEGLKANSKTQWLDIATKWQKASELMKQVKPDHPRYQEAQTRIESYQKNSEVALYKANQLN